MRIHNSSKTFQRGACLVTVVGALANLFLCASALESTRLLLLSRSARNPDGLGAASGALGRYLMDHVYVSAKGRGPPLLEGRCLYLSRFDARESIPFPGPGFGASRPSPLAPGGSRPRRSLEAGVSLG